MHRAQIVSASPLPESILPTSSENQSPAGRESNIASTTDQMLHASSRNNHSLFSFGGHLSVDDTSTTSYDFLPSPSFDDFQNSIATATNDLQVGVPGEREQGVSGGSGGKRSAQAMSSSVSENSRAGGLSRVPSTARPARTSSILRRQSTSTRQSSISSTTSAVGAGTMEPPSAPLAMRTKRNQYPPISGGAAANAARAPRKSIGPGVVDSDFTRPTQRRRPSLVSSVPAQGLSDGVISARINVGATPSYTDGARGLTASRAAKTKSLQPPSRQGQALLHISTPEHNRSVSFATRSPGRANGRGSNTPSSAKRMSVMPGMPTSAAHATGLGARTVSPTDARRAKRLSVLHHAPPMPNTPPHPDISIRTSSRSPSMLPRKVPTPSSSRTTPDPNRKSYSSGLSIGSVVSISTSRTSTGLSQNRASQQLSSSSRLPTPKPRNVHSSTGNNEDEEVPPVPAIPKAYESPKDSPAEAPFFMKRKSSMHFDATSINSSSTNSLSDPAARDAVRSEREALTQGYGHAGSTSDVDAQNQSTPVKRRNLQPLRLPPLNLLPLSTPTAAKVAALQDATPLDGKSTPPRRSNARTPSTPMTASKTSFFSRSRPGEQSEEKVSAHLRSSSSTHQIRPDSLSQVESSSESVKPIPINNRQQRQAVSPFLSSSLPKNHGEHMIMPRSKTSGDFSTVERPAEVKPPRLTGPRAQRMPRAEKSATPPQLSSPEDATAATTSSASSLRRKLSLGWKRSASKSSIHLSHAATERGSGYAPQPPKHDDMPPPKVPASATLNNLSSTAVPSPSPSVKSTTYLDSKRRKSSTSSLNVFSNHDRTRSDSWGVGGSPKKETSQESRGTTMRTAAVMHKMLGSKASAGALRGLDPWLVDLDKDDLSAEDEMRKLSSRRKEVEEAAKVLDALRKRAYPKEHVSPQQAIQIASLNRYERGEIVDYKEVYFCGTQDAVKHVGLLSSDAANFGYDDERGDYTIAPGDHLSYRYEIIDLLGKGSFGQVVRCIDHKTGGLVAVKIIRNKKRFHQQALVEVNILQKLREWDPKNKHSMVSFTQSFYFRGHLCISTELLDMNLYEFIKSNQFHGFSSKMVRRFTKQLLSSLLLLKQHKVIHCDLKPENILLSHPSHTEIKVIDFGSSCFENEKVYTYIQSRFYRSPEVILGMSYGMAIDMWSLGCILAELFTGVPIFPGENEQEQLACIMELFGPPEKHLIEKATRRKLFFDSMGKPRLTVSSKGRRRRPSSKSLAQVLKCDDDAFLDFLARCLRWDPDRRMKPDEAIRHEFLTGQKSSMPTSTAQRKRDESPVKRHHTITSTPLASSNRPLPEPPASAYKNGTAVRNRDVSGGSPTKSTPAAIVRRQSNANAAAAQLASKRVSLGPASLAGSVAGGSAGGGSGLPRVTRSVSAKQGDLASAGATVAVSRRA